MTQNAAYLASDGERRPRPDRSAVARALARRQRRHLQRRRQAHRRADGGTAHHRQLRTGTARQRHGRSELPDRHDRHVPRPAPRSNTPFSFTQDRFKLIGDYRGPGSLEAESAAPTRTIATHLPGGGHHARDDAVGRAPRQARENLTTSLKLAHSLRDNSTYGRRVLVRPIRRTRCCASSISPTANATAPGHAPTDRQREGVPRGLEPPMRTTTTTNSRSA